MNATKQTPMTPSTNEPRSSETRGGSPEPIASADQALRLMTAFRNERNIQLEIRRGNEDLNLNYTID